MTVRSLGPYTSRAGNIRAVPAAPGVLVRRTLSTVELCRPSRRPLGMRGLGMWALVPVLAMAGCSATTVSSGRGNVAVQAVDAQRGQCPTDAIEVPAPARLPAGTHVAELLTCQIMLVRRGAQGWWLQLTERHAVTGLAAYLTAIRIRAPFDSGCGYGGTSVPDQMLAPVLAVDSRGALHQLMVPYACFQPIPPVRTASAQLIWQPAGTRWLRQLIPAGAYPGSVCAAVWQRTLTSYWSEGYWPLQRTLISSLPRVINGAAYFHGYVCSMRNPLPSGPSPADLIAAVHLTAPAEVSRVAAALDGHPGITGPDPIGKLNAPPGSGPLPAACTTPTVHPYRISSGGTILGYADLSLCLKAVAPNLRQRPQPLLILVEQLMTNPYEIPAGKY
jgi:hypothetical protein